MTANSTAVGAVLHARYAHFQQGPSSDDSSIEAPEGTCTNNTSIELPAEITALITGTPYWIHAKTNRYKKLMREGHLDKLLSLARYAHTKRNPAHWFAAACSKARWESQTLPFFAKLRAVAQQAEHVARRLGVHVNRFIYQQIWRGVNVVRWAVAAEETKHDRPGQSRERYFAWLCTHEKQFVV